MRIQFIIGELLFEKKINVRLKTYAARIKTRGFNR